MKRQLCALCVALCVLCSACAGAPAATAEPEPTPTPQPKREWYIGFARSRLDWANGRVSLLSPDGVSLFEIPVRAAGIMLGVLLPPPVDGTRVAFSCFESTKLIVLDTHSGTTAEVDIGGWPEVMAGGGGAFYCGYVKARESVLVRVGRPQDKPLTVTLEEGVGAMDAHGEDLAVAARAPDGKGALLLLDGKTLEEKRRIPLPQGDAWSVNVSGDTAYVAYLPGAHSQDGSRIGVVDINAGTSRVIGLGGMPQPVLQVVTGGGLVIASRYDAVAQEGRTVSFFSAADEKVRHMEFEHDAAQIACVEDKLYVTDKKAVYVYQLPDFARLGSFHMLDDETQFSGLFGAE